MCCAIRPMRAGDVSQVAGLAAKLEQAPHWPEAVYSRMLDDEARPRRMALVAENPNGETTGFVIASLTPPEAELESIVVAPGWQRHGLATALWGELRTKLMADGVTVVHLEVRTGNLPARGLYGRLGFTESGRRRGYYADPAEDAVLFQLDLA